ncbi:Diguanylate cyclase, GGDEF domain [Neomoorella glycerini]|uniref:Diguanylate cyclase, GGDEF domain n=1 Tax=Neomoorella glycerini TaxID=55779 RepID=A0A6I5ZXK0_9FIRM|nr:diguanylate cyclase [Moorella glycerini]QGP94001.1 Diguanylate cyclase, GGDEF domain [Moorella glycerini]
MIGRIRSFIYRLFSEVRDNLKAREELEKFMTCCPLGIIRLDRQFRIMYMNPAMKQILGLQEHEEPVTIGVDIRTIPSIQEAQLENLLARPPENWPQFLEIPFKSIYGKAAYLSVVANPIFNRGKFLGAFITVRDISKFKIAEEQRDYLQGIYSCVTEVLQSIIMAKNKTRLLQEVCRGLTAARGYKFIWIGLIEEESKRVLPAAYAGFEAGYLDTITVTWDETETGRGPTGTAIKTKRTVVIKDIATDPRYRFYSQEALKRGYASTASIPLLYRDRVLGIISVYSFLKNAFGDEEIRLLERLAGALAYALCALETEEKRQEAERALKKSEEHYRTLIEALGEGVALIDAANNIEYVNPALSSLLGYAEVELLGKNMDNFLVRRQAEPAELVPAHPGGKALSYEGQMRARSGEIKTVKVTWVAIKEGETTGNKKLAVFSDITQLKELEQELLRQATEDALTGLYNRCYFNNRIKQEVERAGRYGHPITFIMIDIDDFKEINDRYSHLMGDEVLKLVARYLQSSVRESDLAFRYGGDEFLLVLPETDGPGASKVIARVKEEIAAFNAGAREEGYPEGFKLSLSFGIATWEPESTRKWEEVLKESDLLMYQEKMGKKISW